MRISKETKSRRLAAILLFFLTEKKKKRETFKAACGRNTKSLEVAVKIVGAGEEFNRRSIVPLSQKPFK